MISEGATRVVVTVGHYCGRFGGGFWGEPLNAATTLVSVAVGVIAAVVWRRRGNGDRWQVLLCGLVVLNGAGSFTFHTHPTPLTLQLDLLPEAVFSGAYLVYVAVVRLRLRVWLAVVGLVASLLVEEGLVAVAAGGFGAGVRHVPSLVLLFGVGAYLLRVGDPLGRYAVWAGAAYLAALIFRSYDLVVCTHFRWGLHWLWHVSGAITEGLLLLGVINTSAPATSRASR